MSSTFFAPSETWQPGSAPVAVVMISLNEAHNMEAVLQNLSGWAQEVFLVDSYSADETVDIALRYGVHVVQRKFKGFGDQWNFALNELPIKAPWTMKLDPDERLTSELKNEISEKILLGAKKAFFVKIRLFFMGRALPIRLNLLRIWRTGLARFSDVLANEHANVEVKTDNLKADIEHHDSPNLHHWVEKQNIYTSIESISRFNNLEFAAKPIFLGTPLERRMWFKKYFIYFPFRYKILFLINVLRVQPWITGYEGIAWARLRVWVRRMIEDKLREMRLTGIAITLPEPRLGKPNPNVPQYD